MSYKALVLIAPDYHVSLQDVEMKLVNFFRNDPTQSSMSVSHRENRLVLTLGDWSLYIYSNLEPYILKESEEMANVFGHNHPDRAIIATCNSRLEISSDSDENMDHFNDYVLALEQLGKIPGTFVFEEASLEFV